MCSGQVFLYDIGSSSEVEALYTWKGDRFDLIRDSATWKREDPCLTDVVSKHGGGRLLAFRGESQKAQSLKWHGLEIVLTSQADKIVVSCIGPACRWSQVLLTSLRHR